MLDHPFGRRSRVVVADAQRRQNTQVLVLEGWTKYRKIQKIPHVTASLTWKTNSNVPRGVATCFVSAKLPEMATHTLAVVVAAPGFFDGKITTRYGSSTRNRNQIKVPFQCHNPLNLLVVGYVFVKQK